MTKLKNIIDNSVRFFPIQLLFVHLKKSHLLLLFWLLLFGIVNQNIAMSIGVPYLFFSPEYLGEVNWLSFLLLGMSIGGFFTVFHLYSYILIGPSFPFIATLSTPFLKFCINNSPLPILFYSVLCYRICHVQFYEELVPISTILCQLIALTVGIVLTVTASSIYFFRTNWNISKIQHDQKGRVRPVYFLLDTLFSNKKYWFESYHTRAYQPSFYLSSFYTIAKAREAKHYKVDVLRNVLRQHRWNASLFELALIVLFFFVSYFSQYRWIQIPSSASFLLLCTIVLMVLSIFYSWFKGWAISTLVILAVVLNVISEKTDYLQVKHFAYGLDRTHKTPYNLAAIQRIQFDTAAYAKDVQHHESILNRWHQKAARIQQTNKPKIVILNCSGGGLRAAMWTFHVLQCLDRTTSGHFYPNIHLITGASAGVIGSAYYRALNLREDARPVYSNADYYLDNISKDLLNSTAFDMVMHSLFPGYEKATAGEKRYVKDRGLTFERQLNLNTEGVLDRELVDYYQPEMESRTPLMIFSPTIVNDGRRLIISPQPCGFLNGDMRYSNNRTVVENVEYLKLLQSHSPQRIKFTSVLRMNATFPYILPMVTLPTEPEIHIMDTGMRDNYGTKLTVRYIKAFKDWLKEHTSGVVVVELRDIQKDYDMEHRGNRLSLIQRLVLPLGNFYTSYYHAQEYNAAELLDGIRDSEVPIHVIPFVLRKDPSQKIALSWHLTKREKNEIKRIFDNDYNQRQLHRLIDLLKLK